MYISDIVTKLNRRCIRFGNTEYFEANATIDILNELSREAVRWSVDDFKSVAIEKTNELLWNQYYEEKSFYLALTKMIEDHNAEIGISWDTIDYYLDTYCKIKKYIPLKTK